MTCLCKFILEILAILYGGLIRIWPKLYSMGIFEKNKLSCPVISVGNITVGGTGKTPLVIRIVQYLIEKGFFPVILSRGYKGRRQEGRTESDEGMMLQEAFPQVPVLLGRDRVKVASSWNGTNPKTVFVLDDGFQHFPLDRDLDIVAVNRANPFGNGKVIPRGVLREPLSAIKRADILVLTQSEKDAPSGGDPENELKKINPICLLAETCYEAEILEDLYSGEKIAFEALKGKRGYALCSIGYPQGFWNTLVSNGLDLAVQKALADHHWYIRDEVTKILQECREKSIPYVVTTHKDAVKLKSMSDCFKSDVKCYILKVNAVFVKGQKEFYDRIDSCLHR